MRRKSPSITVTDAYFPPGIDNFGRYEEAVEGWAKVTRPAPQPVIEDDKGRRRLSLRFEEWMLGLPDGWVTDEKLGLRRAEQLKILGNGVVPQQAKAALLELLDRRKATK